MKLRGTVWLIIVKVGEARLEINETYENLTWLPIAAEIFSNFQVLSKYFDILPPSLGKECSLECNHALLLKIEPFYL